MSTMAPPDAPQFRKIRDRLHARRSELLARYWDALDRAEEEQAPSAELVDSANDQWDVRVLSAMTENDAAALDNVIGALNRLEHGNYGVCTTCGAHIEPERLRILPEAAACAECAKFAEERPPRWVNQVS